MEKFYNLILNTINTKNTIVVFFVFLRLQVFAQDTIIFKSRTQTISIVEEINPETIKYKKFDLVDGPLIIVNRNDVIKIKYANGTVDEITAAPVLNNELIKTDSALVNKTNIFSLDLVNLGVKKLNIGYEKIIANGHLGVGINGYYAFDEEAFIYQHLFFSNNIIYESHGVGVTVKYYPKELLKRKGFYVVLNSDYNTNQYKAYNLNLFNAAYEQYLYKEQQGIINEKPSLDTFYSYKKGSTYKGAIGLGMYTSPIANLYISVDGIIGFSKNYLPEFVHPHFSYGYLTNNVTETLVYLRASLKIGYRFGFKKIK
ncbi:MAG: hypothetical protein V4667_03655 [Bacteroidota bacterium]